MDLDIALRDNGGWKCDGGLNDEIKILLYFPQKLSYVILLQCLNIKAMYKTNGAFKNLIYVKNFIDNSKLSSQQKEIYLN